MIIRPSAIDYTIDVLKESKALILVFDIDKSTDINTLVSYVNVLKESFIDKYKAVITTESVYALPLMDDNIDNNLATVMDIYYYTNAEYKHNYILYWLPPQQLDNIRNTGLNLTSLFDDDVIFLKPQGRIVHVKFDPTKWLEKNKVRASIESDL